MKAVLRHMYRGDSHALSMIDTYLNRVAGYDEDEREYLKGNAEALCIDFECWLERLGEEEEETA